VQLGQVEPWCGGGSRHSLRPGTSRPAGYSARVRQLIQADLAASGQTWPQALRRVGQLEPFWLVFVHRMAHALRRLPILPHLLRGLGVVLWSADISPDAQIGGGLRIPHSVGIVIGGARIGENCWIYQNVTVGRGSPKAPGFPVIEDRVRLFAGAVVVGPVTVGCDATVGANAVVRTDVPAGAVAVGNPSVIRST
jgi:serine O-acetyltransferase